MAFYPSCNSFITQMFYGTIEYQLLIVGFTGSSPWLFIMVKIFCMSGGPPALITAAISRK